MKAHRFDGVAQPIASEELGFLKSSPISFEDFVSATKAASASAG
jgi:hypothetical protein